MIEITYSAAEGLLVNGTARGDGSAEVLKAERLRWGRSIGCWYLPHSRDSGRVKRWWVDRVAQALRDKGFEVTVDVDETARPTAVVEAEKAARAEARLERRTDLAERAQARSQAASDRSHQLLDPIPFGQPILVGHHSEKGHRRTLQKADDAMRRSSQEHDKASYHANLAKAAASEHDRRYSPVTVQNRIEKLEAQKRGHERAIEGRMDWRDGKLVLVKPGPARVLLYEQAIAELEEQLTYWWRIREEQKAAGVRSYGPDNVHKGDAVLGRHGWHAVVRVNRKTVTCATEYSWTDTLPFVEIRDVRPGAGEQVLQQLKDGGKSHFVQLPPAN